MSQCFNSTRSLLQRIPFAHSILRALFMVLLISVASACSSSSSIQMNPGADENAVSYVCGDSSEIQISQSSTSEPPSVTLTIDGKRSVLEQVPAASGGKFSDGELTWWSKGDTGLIMFDDKVTHRDCRIAA